MDATEDTRWTRCEGTWDRLRWARLASGFERAKDFADSIGMKDGTYRTYERRPDSSKSAKLDPQDAIRFGKKLGIRWEWLLTGDGTPWTASQYELAFPNKARLEKVAKAVPEEKADAVAQAIEAMLKIG